MPVATDISAILAQLTQAGATREQIIAALSSNFTNTVNNAKESSKTAYQEAQDTIRQFYEKAAQERGQNFTGAMNPLAEGAKNLGIDDFMNTDLAKSWSTDQRYLTEAADTALAQDLSWYEKMGTSQQDMYNAMLVELAAQQALPQQVAAASGGGGGGGGRSGGGGGGGGSKSKHTPFDPMTGERLGKIDGGVSADSDTVFYNPNWGNELALAEAGQSDWFNAREYATLDRAQTLAGTGGVVAVRKQLQQQIDKINGVPYIDENGVEHNPLPYHGSAAAAAAETAYLSGLLDKTQQYDPNRHAVNTKWSTNEHGEWKAYTLDDKPLPDDFKEPTPGDLGVQTARGDNQPITPSTPAPKTVGRSEEQKVASSYRDAAMSRSHVATTPTSAAASRANSSNPSIRAAEAERVTNAARVRSGLPPLPPTATTNSPGGGVINPSTRNFLPDTPTNMPQRLPNETAAQAAVRNAAEVQTSIRATEAVQAQQERAIQQEQQRQQEQIHEQRSAPQVVINPSTGAIISTGPPLENAPRTTGHVGAVTPQENALAAARRLTAAKVADLADNQSPSTAARMTPDNPADWLNYSINPGGYISNQLINGSGPAPSVAPSRSTSRITAPVVDRDEEVRRTPGFQSSVRRDAARALTHKDTGINLRDSSGGYSMDFMTNPAGTITNQLVNNAARSRVLNNNAPSIPEEDQRPVISAPTARVAAVPDRVTQSPNIASGLEAYRTAETEAARRRLEAQTAAANASALAEANARQRALGTLTNPSRSTTTTRTPVPARAPVVRKPVTNRAKVTPKGVNRAV